MTDPGHIYRFVIDGWDPAELPMARLAEYMADLAELLGAHEHVHFDQIEQGSTVLVQHVDSDSMGSVQGRLATASAVHAPEDIAKCVKRIDQRLAADGAIASLQSDNGAEVVRFAGRERAEPATVGPFRQDGCFDGMLIRVGGRDATVPIHLQDGDTIHMCNATRDMARRLAPCLFDGNIRVSGNGRWKREADGHWELVRFDIKDFERLDETPLTKVVRWSSDSGTYKAAVGQRSTIPWPNCAACATKPNTTTDGGARRDRTDPLSGTKRPLSHRPRYRQTCH